MVLKQPFSFTKYLALCTPRKRHNNGGKERSKRNDFIYIYITSVAEYLMNIFVVFKLG